MRTNRILLKSFLATCTIATVFGMRLQYSAKAFRSAGSSCCAFQAHSISIYRRAEFRRGVRPVSSSSSPLDLSPGTRPLDFQNRSDLADYFIERYLAYSKDEQLRQLLAFYKCYRAHVRGKVISFRLDDANITVQEKKSATTEAQAYFKLAAEYAKKL